MMDYSEFSRRPQTRDDYDPSCLAFGCTVPRTMNGHLCRDCFNARYGITHANWYSRSYLSWMERLVARSDQRNTAAQRRAEKKVSA